MASTASDRHYLTFLLSSPCATTAAATAASRAGLMKISLQAQDLVFELLSDKVTDLLDSSLMFIEVSSSTITTDKTYWLM